MSDMDHYVVKSFFVEGLDPNNKTFRHINAPSGFSIRFPPKKSCLSLPDDVIMAEDQFYLFLMDISMIVSH